MRNFLVLKKITLGYDSTIHAPTPNRHKTHHPGTILRFESEAFNGNVWFVDPEDERGKTEAGSLENLTRKGTLKEIDA